ncbi:hypothetical protein FQA39_LY17893 [Lamprigera yunnana]|nr:hypothetical protein FQA39_LY17893 [Lamprigera yunnana]
MCACNFAVVIECDEECQFDKYFQSDLNDSDEEDMVVDGGEDTCGSSNSSEKMNSDTEDSESEEVPVLPQSDSEEDINFEINDFVVTKFTTEEDNRCRLYLGKIMEIGISECNISFLRKKIGAKELTFISQKCLIFVNVKKIL